MSTYHLLLVIPHLPLSINAIGRKHWSIKAAESRRWRTWVIMVARGKQPTKPLEKASIIYTRHSKREMDFDNLVSSFKAAQDGLVDAGIIKNDTPKVIGTPSYLWEKCSANKGWITIHVRGEV